MESDQKKWIDSVCINIGDPEDTKKYKLITDFASLEYGKRAVIATFEDLLYRYMRHPEAKSLAPDGGPCKGDTRGLLQRTHIVAGEFHRIGKEGDRRWEEGDDLESIRFESTDYDRDGVSTERMAKPTESLVRKIKKIGVKELVRFGCGERILKKICRRERVRVSTLHEYERMIRDWKSKRKKKGGYTVHGAHI